MLDTLVDRQDGDVAGAGKASMAEDLLQAAQHLGAAVRARDDPVDEVGAWEVELLPGESRGAIGEQVLGFGAEKVLDSLECRHGLPYGGGEVT